MFVMTNKDYSGMKSKKTAILLNIFLWVVGAHWWYLGNKRMGIMWLLTCGCLGWGSILSLIYLICLSKETFDAKYNSGKVE